MLPPLYIYWEGPKHPYYECCIDTIMRHNPSTTLLDQEMTVEIVGPLPEAVRAAYVVHRVDWIRKRLVYETGGMYVDADFICFRPLDSFRHLASDFDFVGYKEWGGSGTWMDNFFVGRQKSPILKAAADFALAEMERMGRDVPWLATNAHAICHGLDRHRWTFALEIPTHLVSPISVMQPLWFKDESPLDANTFRCFGFMTSYHALGGWYEGRSKDEILASPSRLGQLLRFALK